MGALSGAIGGVFDCFSGPIADAVGARFGKVAGFAAQTALDGVCGAIGNDVTQVLTNIAQHQPWYQGLAKQSAVGFTQGALFSALSAGAQSLVDNPQASTLNQNLRKMATSSTSLQLYASGAFYLGNQFVVWGSSQSWGKGAS